MPPTPRMEKENLVAPSALDSLLTPKLWTQPSPTLRVEPPNASIKGAIIHGREKETPTTGNSGQTDNPSLRPRPIFLFSNIAPKRTTMSISVGVSAGTNPHERFLLRSLRHMRQKSNLWEHVYDKRLFLLLLFQGMRRKRLQGNFDEKQA